MILPITSEFRLASDSHAWMIQKLKLRKHRQTKELVATWESIKWFTSLESAVTGLAQLMLRTSEAQTLAQALHEVENVTARLGKALAPQFEIKAREVTR